MADLPRFDPDADDDEDDDASADGPWPIRLAPPRGVDGWMRELVAGFAQSAHPPAIQTEDDEVVEAEDSGLLEAGVMLCLHQRGAAVTAEQVGGLIEVIGEMVGELTSMGPEWERLSQVPPLAFTIYYLWSHIVIGHLTEDEAMEVVNAATHRLDEFDSDGSED